MTMGVSRIHAIRQWVKARNSPLADFIYRLGKWSRHASVPVVRPIHWPLYVLHRTISEGWSNLTRIVWYTPLFQSRLVAPAPRLYLYDGMPLTIGPVRIKLGAGCRVGGHSNIVGRSSGTMVPELIVGDNVDLGWGASISVGRQIRIGNNVRLAAQVFLAGFAGHPLDAAARARGEPDTEDQVGDIVLEDDVWLGTGASVLAGVTIGRGTIVGTGSVVTKDLPPFVLAGGAPARVIRQLERKEGT